MDIRDPDLKGIYEVLTHQEDARTLKNEDLWIELSIKGKKRELLKQEMTA